MVANVHTVAFQGISALPVSVQVQVSSGLPAFHIVGLPDKAVAESRERIRASFYAISLALPPKRITVNLSPADIQKEGSHYDLPIALGLMVAMGIISNEEIEGYSALGELSLDGRLTRVSGVLAAAISAVSNQRGLICPEVCGIEAAWSGSKKILAAANLIVLINHFKGTQVLTSPQPTLSRFSAQPSFDIDFKEVKGQQTAKRALEVAAAGGHNLLMCGPPGSGKSMLAARLPTILPALDPQESLTVSMIHSLAGLLPPSGLVRQAPYRDPHHSASLPSLIGGGLRSKPGEVSIAHHGVLFLDELPEFSSSTLESLRQPVEMGKVTVSRVNAHVTYPAKFQLIAAMNPCRCGFYGDPKRACRRVPICAQDYQKKISGPLMDRFDMVIDVPEVSVHDLTKSTPSEGDSSQEMAHRVLKARSIQKERFKALSLSLTLNSSADGEILRKIVDLDKDGQALLSKATDKLGLSARSYHRVLRLSRTLADLDNQTAVQHLHIAEALMYRRTSSTD